MSLSCIRLLCVFLLASQSRSEAIKSSFGLPDRNAEAAAALIERILPNKSQHFDLSTKISCRQGHAACYTVALRGDKVRISGSTGVELASGFHEFLKVACNSSISWELTGGSRLDTRCLEEKHLLGLGEGFRIDRGRAVPWHYYQNVVTVSYSSAWWDWDRWEQELDWMAMNGINLPLAFTGQELVWQRVYERFGVSKEELADFFTGPGYLAWGRMGNIQGYGGPLPQNWIEAQAGLQKKILRRMRELGMTPVLPGFAGFVPRALVAKFPAASVVQLPNWGHFPEEFCCVNFLEPLDPLFHDIGRATVEEMRREFGDDSPSFYSADSFNEMLPPSSDPKFLASTSHAVFSAMEAADPGAVWLMQAWTFFNDQHFWQKPQIEAYIRGVPQGRLVLLDLFAEVSPIWEATDSFFGAPFIWCMLHNFGGNSEMYGDMQSVAAQPGRALASNSSVVGFGLCMEAIEQNPVMYSLMNEWPFRDEPIDVKAWLGDYVRNRYGGDAPKVAVEAWQLLRTTVYAATDKHLDHAKDIPTSRPGLRPEEIGQWGLRPEIWYDERQVAQAWQKLVIAARSLRRPPSTLLFDVVDVGRQVLSKVAGRDWRRAVEAYERRDRDAFGEAALQLLNVLVQMDGLLATNQGFMLGPRLEAAKAAAESAQESKQLELNFLSQITVWGLGRSGPSEVEDYANREWSGLLQAYYFQRWRLWIERLDKDLELGRGYDAEAWSRECEEFSKDWLQQEKKFPVEPVGDVLLVSSQLLSRHFPTLGQQNLEDWWRRPGLGFPEAKEVTQGF